MMHRHLKTLGAALLLLSSSCSLHEELFLNRDGSGRYVFKVDLGELLNNPQFTQMMAGQLGTNLPGMDEDTGIVLTLPGDFTLPTLQNADSLIIEEIPEDAYRELPNVPPPPPEPNDSIDIVTLGAEGSGYAPGADSLAFPVDSLTEEDLAWMEEEYGNPEKKNPLSEVLKGDFLKQLRADATIYLSSLPQKDSNKLSFVDDPLFQRLFVRIEVDLRENAPRKIMEVGIGFDFDHPSQIAELPRSLEKMSDLGQNLPPGLPNGMGVPNLSEALSGYGTYLLNGRRLERQTSPNRPEMNELMDQLYAESQDDPELAGMAFGSPEYRLTIHLPGRITRNTFANSRVKDNTLQVTLPLADFFRGKYPMVGQVKFR